MRRPDRIAVRIAGLAVLAVGLVSAPDPAVAAEPPVVFAVDTSRSLTAPDLAEVRSLIAAVLDRLPAAQPAGLLAFDDAPRWLVPLPGSPRAVQAALSELAPRGDFTLLHDALFTIVRAMPEGGAVVLLTDGWDENSATTVEDVASLAQSQGVRLLPVLVGRRDGSRPLRRLALLTDGHYLGRASGEQVARRVGSVLAAAAAARSTAQAPTPRSATPPPASEPAGGTAGAADPARAPSPATVPAWIAWALGLAALVVLGVIAVSLRRRERAPATVYCPTCGSELAEGERCPHCAETELKERLARRPVARLENTAELALSALEEVEPEPAAPGVLERTRVLNEHHVIQVQEAGKPARSFLLRREEAFAIGRDPAANTLSVGDPALSARHLKIVPEDGMFYVVDLESTNGTFLGHERVEARRLRPGDVIRAGQLTIEYRIVTRTAG